MKCLIRRHINAALSIATAIAGLLGMGACSREPDGLPEGNAIYYWRTSLRLNESELRFLKHHDIRTVYTRFFDVVEDNGRLRPESTLIFTDRMPGNIEIVPVVFIDSRALRSDSLASGLAPLLLARVDSMMSKNGDSPTREVQIDFDWTKSNAKRYFSLLSELADSLHAKGRLLSATIRLHQLAMKAPPADYGALMVYNIGNFKNPDEENSIISTRRLREYIGYLSDYPLPLRGALPLYGWDLLFRNNKFVAIVRGVDLSDTTAFRPIGANRFAVGKYMPMPVGASGASPGSRILPGDIIRHEQPSAATLDSVARMLGSRRSDIRRRTILYHLDRQTIEAFCDEEIEKIYSGS